MTTALADLVARVTDDVPPLNGCPTPTQYDTCVKDAVIDLGRRVPVVKTATIATVAGQAVYALPADCMRVISLSTIGGNGGDVLVTGAGLIPLNTGFREQWSMVGQTIVIRPVPQFDIDRTLTYAAGDVLDADEAYPDMTPARAAVVLCKARELALRRQVTKTAGEAQRPAGNGAGDGGIDTTPTPKALGEAAEQERQAYEQGIRDLNGYLASGISPTCT